MIIRSNSSLTEIAKRMGNRATTDDARRFLDALLAAGFEGADTRDISEHDWCAALAAADDRALA